ncbi:DUF3185 family protein [Rhodohalobacter sp. 8-1]|uniref:DUF3185 family protein n=1 Tax=Rhodohalobacter sp. 8-1 TaxID=3131972 RepID=UPI0030EF86E2
MIHKKIISLLFLLLGITLLYIGIEEIYLLSTYLNKLIPIKPDTETRLMIILGAAASISGFVGIIRDRAIEV